MVVGGRELIDTLWNVNVSYKGGSYVCLAELIDTLWNVNDVDTPVLKKIEYAN